MESLNDTTWDVLLCGTGLPQSLLALALSRSGKKVLHIDKNDYYGGSEAAFSLQEAEAWVEKNSAASTSAPFSSASIRPSPSSERPTDSRLSFSRAYGISLSPQLIYARSNLVPALVASKVYRQLEFLAVGTWWIYDVKGPDHDRTRSEEQKPIKQEQKDVLRKIPGSREDAFADRSISLRSTRSLMKILKSAADPETYPDMISQADGQSFPDFLESRYNIDPKLQAPLQALTLSLDPPAQTSVAYAISRLHRHITSTGIFGPGFGAVVPKWGGLAEIAQVACRAGAVGGGVYVLKQGIDSISRAQMKDEPSTTAEGAGHLLSKVKLQDGENVKARWILGTRSTLHGLSTQALQEGMTVVEVTHLTAIVSSPLTSLFPPPAEGSPPPAGVVVIIPPSSLELPVPLDMVEIPAVYFILHSSDTGECPEGQSIIYTFTTLSHSSALDLLFSALEQLLSAVPNEPSKPEILWSLTYKQHHASPPSPSPSNASSNPLNSATRTIDEHRGILYLQDLDPSLALEDDVLADVRAAWERITADDGGARGAFMQFEDREAMGGEDEDVY